MKTHHKLLIILLVLLGLSILLECIFARNTSAKHIEKMNLWVVVEPGAARTRLTPNSLSTLTMEDGDSFSIENVSAWGKVVILTLHYKHSSLSETESKDNVSTVKVSESTLMSASHMETIYCSELPKKIFNAGKWTVWVKKEE